MALDANINRLKFVRTKTAGRAPSATDIQEGELAMNLVDQTLYGNNNGTIFRFIDPDKVQTYQSFTSAHHKINGAVAGSTYSGKGALVIKLPKSKFPTSTQTGFPNTMLKFRINGYNLSANSSYQLFCSGYTYTPSPGINQWYLPTVHYEGSITPPFQTAYGDIDNTIKFVTMTDCFAVIVGDTTTTWANANFTIDDVSAYYTSSNAGWDTGWEITFLTDATEYNTLMAKANTVKPPIYGTLRARTADKFYTPSTFNYTGDATGTVTFDGSETTKSVPLTITRKASTSQDGIVQLFDGVSSTSTTMALTANMGKVLGDAVNTKVDKINPTSSGTLTHTGAASTSGLLNAAGGISTSSLSISTGSISKTDGTGYLSFLQGGAALGINIGDLLVSNSYSDRSKIPVNGAYLKGGLDADNVIRGATGTGYNSLTAIGVGTSIPFKLKDTNIGTSYGFVPGFGMNVQTTGGYRQVVSIGAYRPGSNWTDSGVYIATGATNDGYSSEAFLLKSGRTISNTAGPINLIGNADTASNIDASTGSLVGDASGGWRKLGRATVPQNGRALMLQIFGGTGFNAGVPTQAMCTEIVLKGGNGGPTSINMVVHVPDSSNILANLGEGVANACFVPVTGDDYDIYINCVGYLRAGIVAIKGALTDWALNFDVAGVSTKPTGAVDAAIYTKAYTTSNVASATKLQNSRTINGVNFDGTANIKIQQESVAIPANANLTNYTTEGFYFCAANVTAATVTGTPFNPSGTSSSAVAFSLLVEASAGVKQTYTSYASGATRTWVRGIYQGSPSAWREVAFCNSPTFVDTATFNGPIVASSTLSVTGTAGFNTVTANNLSATTSVNAGTGLGISNSTATTKYGLSLYGGASTGKPSYGVLFTGTSNSDTGAHGDVNGQWSVYFTCATAGSEKRGWIFQRSSGGSGVQNVASISTDGNMVINGNFDTALDNTMIRVGNNNDLAMVKKAGSSAFIAVGSNTAFRVLKSPIATVDPTQSYVNLMTVTTSGDLDLAGNNVLIGPGTLNNTYQAIQFGNYTKSASGGGFSVLHMSQSGGTEGRSLQLANYNQAGAMTSAIGVTSAGAYQIIGTTTTRLATINDNAPTASILETARTISITGDATWSTTFNGSANVTGVMTLSNSGVTAGTHKAVTVDAKGRVTAGVSYIVGLVTSTSNTGTTNAATGNTNTYLNVVETLGGSTSSVGSSQRIQGSGGVTVSSDTSGNITIAAPAVAPSADKWSTARTITFTGDTTGSVSIDGSANVSAALTTRSATTSQTGIVQLNDTLTSASTTQALTAKQGAALNTRMNEAISGIAMYDDTAYWKGISEYNPSDVNTRNYPIQIMFSVSYGDGPSPPYAFELTNLSTGVMYRCPGDTCLTVPPGHQVKLCTDSNTANNGGGGGNGFNRIVKVVVIR